VGYWGSRKPPFGTPVDRSHPLSQGLIGCFPLNEGGGGSVGDAVYGDTAAFHGASWSPRGGVDCTAASAGVYSAAPARLRIQPPLTVMWRGVNIALAATAGMEFLEISYATSGSPFIAYGFWGAAGAALTLAYNSAGSTVQVGFGTAPGVGRAFALAGTIAPGFSAAYVDGSRKATAAGATSINYGSGSQLLFGVYTGETGPAGVIHDCGYIWQGVLTPDLIGWASAEPYAMFAGPRRNTSIFTLTSSSTKLFRRTLYGRAGSRGVA
jgi:hypothetical protein